MNARMGWGVSSFQAPRANGNGDRYHVLPEQIVTGTGPAVSPWLIGAGVVAVIIFMARGARNA